MNQQSTKPTAKTINWVPTPRGWPYLLVREHAAVVDEFHGLLGAAVLARAGLLDATAVHPHLQGAGLGLLLLLWLVLGSGLG